MTRLIVCLLLLGFAQPNAIASPVAATQASQALTNGNSKASLSMGQESRRYQFGRKLSGRIKPHNSIKLQLPVGGRVVGEQLRMGQRIKRGQVLVRLDDREARHTVALRRAEQQLAAAQHRHALKQKQRIETNHTKGLLSDLDVDKAQLELEQGSANLQIAKARLGISELLLSEHRLLAPTDGVLLNDGPAPGSHLSANSLAITLIDDCETTVSMQLSSAEVSALREQKLRLVARTERVHSMRILRVAPSAQPNSTLFTVEATADVASLGAIGSVLSLELLAADEATLE